MALFSTWYSGGGPVPWEGQDPGQLRRSGVPLPFHFAFPVFPSLFLPAATLPCEGHKGTIAGLFSPLLHQAASSSLAQGPHWQREAGCQAQPLPPCRVSAVNQGSRVVLGSGEGQGCVSAMPCSLLGVTFLYFTITRTFYSIIYILYTLTFFFFFFPFLIYCLYF